MTSEPRAFFTVDLGSATVATGIVGLVDGRWRLLASAAFPVAVDTDAILALLARRVADADAELAAKLGLGPGLEIVSLPRLVTRSTLPPGLVILAGSERQRSRLEAVAATSGWRIAGRSAESADPLTITTLALRPQVAAILLGADEPPGADERGLLGDLAALVAAVLARRPDLRVFLAGGAARQASVFAPATVAVVAPAAARGDPPGESLAAVLREAAAGPDDARSAFERSLRTLALILDRRIEAVEIGAGAGMRCQARPAGEAGTSPVSRSAVVAGAALVPGEPAEGLLDAVVGWSTIAVDRQRLADRLRELRATPWAEATGDGAIIRLAALRAALGRLVAATPSYNASPAPDLLVASGGAWATVPPPAVALALIDVVRRPGVTQLALDHARILAPLGVIHDEGERLEVLDDLVDDALLPLGSAIVPRGARAGRGAGRLVVRGDGEPAELRLEPGTLQLVDLPPGQEAIAELEFRDPVDLGVRSRRVSVAVAGGLGGLLVDLRDVPLRLPARQDRRRELLGGWQRALWPDMDR